MSKDEQSNLRGMLEKQFNVNTSSSIPTFQVQQNSISIRSSDIQKSQDYQINLSQKVTALAAALAKMNSKVGTSDMTDLSVYSKGEDFIVLSENYKDLILPSGTYDKRFPYIIMNTPDLICSSHPKEVYCFHNKYIVDNFLDVEYIERFEEDEIKTLEIHPTPNLTITVVIYAGAAWLKETWLKDEYLCSFKIGFEGRATLIDVFKSILDGSFPEERACTSRRHQRRAAQRLELVFKNPGTESYYDNAYSLRSYGQCYYCRHFDPSQDVPEL